MVTMVFEVFEVIVTSLSTCVDISSFDGIFQFTEGQFSVFFSGGISSFELFLDLEQDLLSVVFDILDFSVSDIHDSFFDFLQGEVSILVLVKLTEDHFSLILSSWLVVLPLVVSRDNVGTVDTGGTYVSSVDNVSTVGTVDNLLSKIVVMVAMVFFFFVGAIVVLMFLVCSHDTSIVISPSTSEFLLGKFSIFSLETFENSFEMLIINWCTTGCELFE